MKRPERLSTRVVLSHELIEVREHELDRGEGRRQRVVTLGLRDWVVVAATDARGRYVLVEQHRHGVDAMTLECAGGVVDPGETPEQAALRELVEETGYDAPSGLRSLGWVHPNPALHDNRAFFFVARAVTPAGQPENTHEEETRVKLLTEEAVVAALRNATITHAMSVLALERALRAADEVG